jgi:putative endonuclease
LAEAHLKKAGYRILERNVRTRYGEIDLVALDADCLVFVEVRTRRSPAPSPEESVTWRKRRRLASLGARYVQDRDMLEVSWRIDVVAVEMGTDGRVTRLEHYVNAVEDPS